jgi:hypothetical protein
MAYAYSVVVALILIVSSNGTSLWNGSYRTYRKAQYTHMTYITTYPPSGTHAFNVAWTVLHTSQGRIHVWWKWPQDIPWSLLALGTRS